MGVNSDILTWWQGRSPPKAQSAVLSVPWEYLRFFSMIGFIPCTGTLFSPFASPLWSIFDRFFACSTHILDDIMDNDTWVCKSSKNATPFQRETNQYILGPTLVQSVKGSLLSTLLAVLLCNMLFVSIIKHIHLFFRKQLSPGIILHNLTSEGCNRM